MESKSISDVEGVVVECDTQARQAVVATRDCGRVLCGPNSFTDNVKLGDWFFIHRADIVQPNDSTSSCGWVVNKMTPISSRLTTTVRTRRNATGIDEKYVEIGCPVVMGSVREQHGIAWSGLGRVYVPRDRIPIMRIPGSAFEVAIVSVLPKPENGDCLWEVSCVLDSTVFNAKCVSVVVSGFDDALNLCRAEVEADGSKVIFAHSDWFTHSTAAIYAGKRLQAWVGARGLSNTTGELRSFYVYDPEPLKKSPSSGSDVRSTNVTEEEGRLFGVQVEEQNAVAREFLIRSAMMYEPRNESFTVASGTALVRRMMEDPATFADLLQHDAKLLTDCVQYYAATS